MKRLLIVLCLASFSNLVFASDSDLDDLLHKAIDLRQAGKPQAAKPIAEQAVALAEKRQDWPHLWSARQELLYDYGLTRDYDRVLQLGKANLETVRKNAKAFSNLAEAERKSVETVGRAYSAKHDYVNAVRTCLEELALAEEMQRKEAQPGMLAYPLQRLGINFYLAGQFAEAEWRMRQAYSKFVESGASFSDNAGMEAGQYEAEVEILRWLERALVAQRRYDEALETSELARSRAFAAELARRAIKGSNEPIAPSIQKIRTIAREHNATLVEYSVLYEYEPESFSNFMELRAATIYIWVVQPGGRTTFHESPLSPHGPSLTEMVDGARHSVGAFGRGISVDPEPSEPKTGHLQNLYTLLIAPITPDLPREPERVVTFVPQDSLYMVPFAALEDNNGHYLVEQHTINAAPSLSILDLTHHELTTHHGGKGVLVVGNPAMPSLALAKDAAPVRLNSLPKAEAEARTIAARFHATPLIGQAATKDEVLRRIFNAQIVHLATHGLLDRNGGLQGALAFAPTADDSGFLTVLELQSLKLDADLVVLSACDTALGRVSGDGVLGFSRSFLTAGTPSLVVSLWSVPDESTGYLMEHFYQRLQLGKDKAQSLRGAMLDTKQKFPHPNSWAAFTLLGESAVAPGLRTVAGSVEPISRARLNLMVFRFPVPADVYDLRESPNREFEDPVSTISFRTAMSLQDLFSYYQTAMEGRDLMKSGGSSAQNVSGAFSLAYRGPWKDRDAAIQGVDWTDLKNTRVLTLHFERRHDDDAEFTPGFNEKLAGIALPPHATGLGVTEKFQAADGKADVKFFTALPALQVRALYSPIFKKLGFAEYPHGGKKITDKLTLEFHGPVKDRALFLSVGKSPAHPQQQVVQIRFDKPSGN